MKKLLGTLIVGLACAIGLSAIGCGGDTTKDKDKNKKTDTAKVDAAKVDTAKVDAAKVDAAKVDAAKVDAAKVDVAKVDVAKVDAAKVDAAKVDAAKVDAAKVDAAKADAAKADKAKVDGAKADGKLPPLPPDLSSLTITPKSEAVTVKQGGSAKVEVNLKRTNLKDALTLEFKDLPKGVSAKDNKVAGDKDAGTVTLEAANDAEVVKDRVVTVSASGADAAKDAKATFKLTVEKK